MTFSILKEYGGAWVLDHLWFVNIMLSVPEMTPEFITYMM